MVDGEPGMEAVEGRVVGSGAEQGQADIPAHEQITGEMPFELAVGAGVGPGTDEFGKDKGAHGKGGRSAGAGGMIGVTAGSKNGRGVVEASDATEGMAGTLEEHGVIDKGTDPGEDEGEKAAEESLDDRREVREVGGRVRGRKW